MAELVDAADSKSAVRKGVKVRFLSWARRKSLHFLRGFFLVLYKCLGGETCLPSGRLVDIAFASVAKLVDALPSGGSVRKDVLVRIQSGALE